jgi:hypothetical protein
MALTAEQRAKGRINRWKHLDKIPKGTRHCSNCNTLKLLNEFHKHSGCRDGYNSVCKECRKVITKQQWKDTSLEYKILNRARSRATTKNIEFNLELSDIIIPKECPIFKVPFIYNDKDWSASIDRVDPNKGYVKGNIMIISNKANRIKNDATLDDLKQVVSFYSKVVGL